MDIVNLDIDNIDVNNIGIYYINMGDLDGFHVTNVAFSK